METVLSESETSSEEEEEEEDELEMQEVMDYLQWKYLASKTNLRETCWTLRS